MRKKNANSLEQIERFKQTARDLGCDEDEAAFDEKLMALAKRRDGHKPPIATDATKGKTIVES